MQKVLLIVSVLFTAVISTACINNLAVQDLNNKAQTYMEQGDYTQAIERLKSSIDLDSNIFETQYNLAIAYTKNDDYVNAIEQYKKAIKLKPDFAQVYYSLATTQNNFAKDIEKAKIIYENDSWFRPSREEYVPEEGEVEMEVQLGPKEFQYMNELYAGAQQNYKKYLELEPKAKEKDEIEKELERISEILKYNSQVNY